METPKNGDTARALQLSAARRAPLVLDAATDALAPDLGVDEDGGLLRTWQIFRRHRLAVLGLAVTGAVCGVLITIYQRPQYRAHTSLEIQGLNEGFLNIRDVNAVSPSSDVQTEVRVLQSTMLRERARLRAEKELAAAAAPPEERSRSWRKAFGFRPRVNRNAALRGAAGHITVLSTRENRIVDILCDSPDPQASAAFANALAKEYIEQRLEARWETAQRTSEWLNRTLEELRAKLQKSEERLQEYTNGSGLMFTTERDSAAEDSLKQLQAELSRAQADRLSRQARYAIAVASPPDSMPEVLSNGTINQYQVQLTDLRKQLAELSTAFTPEYPKIKRMKAQIAELESALSRDRANIAARIRTEYESALRREELLQAAYDAQAKVVVEQAGRLTVHGMLKREVEGNRRLYDTMLQKVKEAGIASAMQANNIRVVDPARPPSAPFKPSPFVTTLLAATAGLFGGMLLVVVREVADRSIHRPGLARVFLNVPELGAIPSRKAEQRALAYGRASRAVAAAATGEEPVELATWHGKTSLIAESFRAALASILYSTEVPKRLKTIVVTSPGPMEGKTSVISNLGIALAEINRRVLLIDGDMRSPTLHRVFNLPNTWGLSDLLSGKQDIGGGPLEALARATEVPGVFVLPGGPGALSISNLLHSARLTELLDRVAGEFDAVLVDTPPMLGIPDARVLGRLADGAIMVIRAGKTHREAALAAVQRLREDGTLVLGTILNYWDPRSMGGPYASAVYAYPRRREAS